MNDVLLQEIDFGEWFESNSTTIAITIGIYYAAMLGCACIVYVDAKKRKHPAGSCTLLAAFLGIPGIALYLFRRGGALGSMVRAGVVLGRIAMGIAIFLLATIYCAYPIYAIMTGIVDAIDAWPSIGLGLALSGIFGVLAWAGGANRAGCLITFGGVVVCILAVWNPMYRGSESNASVIYQAIAWSLLLVMVIGGFSALFNFFGMGILDENLHRGRGDYMCALGKRGHQHYRELVLGLSMVLAFTVVGAVAAMPSSGRAIVITPRDYQAKIAFWAGFNYDLYDSNEKDALDRFNATLVIYHPPNVTSTWGRNYFINNTREWLDHYPNVRIMPSVQGITRIANYTDEARNYFYNTYPWDGSTDGVIYWSKELLNVSKTNNLTNVVGLNVDLESPDEVLATTYGIDINPNTARHERSVELYDDFFQWFRTAYPDMSYTATMGTKATVDVFDGDRDLQVDEMTHIYDVHGWDEIAPMIYPCGCSGTPPYGDVPRPAPGDEGDPSSSVYYQLKKLESGLLWVDGNSSRIGIYLGITNCSCYGRDVEQYDPLGHYIGHGFDRLVQDSLIAKHFGCETITLFILNSANTSSGSDAHVMGGVFDSYGSTFLDDYMAAINGPNSTTPFTIYMMPDTKLLNDFSQDLLFDIGKPAGAVTVLAIVAAIIVCSALMHPSAKARVFAARKRGAPRS